MTEDSELNPRQVDLLEKISTKDLDAGAIRVAFQDPGDAYVHCPVALSMRDLIRLYHEDVDPIERADLAKTLRSRSRLERWSERRAIVQAKRLSARREAYLSVEAEVWAMVGVEFQARRVRSMMERWECLDAYVSVELERLEAGEGVFTPAIRDAVRELDAIEQRIAEILPGPDVSARGKEFWSAKVGDRQQMISRIEERLAAVEGADRASKVFEVIEGGAFTVIDGGED